MILFPILEVSLCESSPDSLSLTTELGEEGERVGVSLDDLQCECTKERKTLVIKQHDVNIGGPFSSPRRHNCASFE